MQRNNFFQAQIEAITPSSTKKFFAAITPSCLKMPVIGQKGYSPPVVGLASGVPAAGIFAGFAAGMSLGMFALPAWVLSFLTINWVIAELQENNRDVELAQKEIEYLSSLSNPPPVGEDTIIKFFTKGFDLNYYSKQNILNLILKHEDINLKIKLLEQCLEKPQGGDNQKTALAERFWKQEGFFACRADTGTLGEIQNHLHALKWQRDHQGQPKTYSTARFMARAR